MCKENLVFPMFGKKLEISNGAFVSLYNKTLNLQLNEIKANQLVFKEIV